MKWLLTALKQIWYAYWYGKRDKWENLPIEIKRSTTMRKRRKQPPRRGE